MRTHTHMPQNICSRLSTSAKINLIHLRFTVILSKLFKKLLFECSKKKLTNQKLHCNCKTTVKLDLKLTESSSNKTERNIELNNKNPATKKLSAHKERVKLSIGLSLERGIHFKVDPTTELVWLIYVFKIHTKCKNVEGCVITGKEWLTINTPIITGPSWRTWSILKDN